MDSNQLHLKAHSEASSIEDDTCKDVVQYKLKIFESISKIEKNNWDKIVGLSGITRSHDYLRAIESSKIQLDTHAFTL